MTSSPPRRLARLYRRVPLRVKLVAAVMSLVAVALVGSAVVARTTLNRYLINRLDAQLKHALSPIAIRGNGGGPGPDRRPGSDGGDRGDRLPSAYVVAETNASAIIVSGPTSSLLDPGQPLPLFPHLTGAESRAAGAHVLTVRAVSGDGQWRVLAEPVTLADHSTGTLLVAQSLADVHNTVNRLTLLLLVIGAAAEMLIAAVGYLVVRASLRPLRAVERAAAQIAAGDLSQRVVDADPRTEVGQLSRALNAMLTEIETAFAERASSEQAARSSERRMVVSEAAARRSEDRMRAFVADASHELRTPLTTIRGFAELYRQGAVSGSANTQGLIRRIEDEAARMGVLVDDLMLLARLDQQRPLTQLPVDLLALCRDAVQNARVVGSDRDITLTIGAVDPPPVVIGEQARLRQVLANLLTNALQHTPAGTAVDTRIDTGNDDAGRPSAFVTVTDQGPGLPAEAAEHVFERFYRTDNSRNRNDGGTGLGLAIVAGLVAAHGGSVAVHSEPGHGARFTVVLPLAQSPGAILAP